MARGQPPPPRGGVDSPVVRKKRGWVVTGPITVLLRRPMCAATYPIQFNCMGRKFLAHNIPFNVFMNHTRATKKNADWKTSPAPC